MQYVLGNMLNGGGINPDGLSLDLQFAADKTLTARRGPTPDFTRGSTATFVGSDGLIQSAAINIPRFDHDPVTLASRGLLIEESRTNAFQRSDDFGNSYWIKLRSTITSDATTSPSGATDADKLVEDTSTNSHIFYRLVNVGVTTPVSFSVFAKASERSWIQLECGDNFTAGSTAYFNLSNGTIGTVGAGATASIQSMGNGWYRCVVVATPAAITNSGFYVNIATANGTRSYAGDGTSGVFLWGAQLEAGSFPTSYIPTTTAPLARSADVCSITGANFTSFYNQSEGTMLVNSSCFAPEPLALPSRRVVTASDGTTGNRVAIGNIATGFVDAGLSQVFIVTTGGSVQATLGISGLTLSSINKTVGAYKENDFAVSTNSSAVVTDATGLVATSLNRLEIGNQISDGFLCGHIAAIRYYKKRLPNAKLQALTV
jgi:hypothetical protein